uniref:Small ribosomal subunit protein uS3c n=1 Tax=Prasiolopsis wulf-kochii TaxID=3239232 RepID=A0A097KK29_9CHLO|nr:ribosomal protein S3 [Prasiolopsis sp. SAG 84.81]
MGQKVHPLGFRLGITKKHKSQWFAKTGKYPQLVLEDYFVRKLLMKKFLDAGIESIKIERTLNQIKVEIYAARANIFIGRDKKNLDQLRELLEKKLQIYRARNFNVLNVSNFANSQIQSKLACSTAIFKKNSEFYLEASKSSRVQNKNKTLEIAQSINSPKISIHIIKLLNPDTKAGFVADSLVERLEKRGSFRQAMKTAIRRCQRANVKGIKIQVSGRLNGAEIARTEWIREGRVPLQTLRANIDYSHKTAKTIYGILGVKIWIFNGEINT